MLRDALVVGVNTYQNLPGLKAPARDAEAVAKMLQTYGEFRVHRLPEVIQSGQPQIGQKTQVTLQMLESALIQLFKPKGRSVAHTALFYFSGHGLQREAGIREGFLAPSNVDPDRGFYGLSLFWLRRLLQESPVRQRIVILDCCHSGELLNFLEADPGATPETDRLFMAASREYETAYESIDSPYSVFTQALLTGLDPQRSSTGIINHHALTDWVNHQLKGEIQQPLFESSGSEIILTRQLIDTIHPAGKTALHRSETATALHCPLPGQTQFDQNLPVCPYRGLDYFDESHAEFFFGREALTAELLQKLKTHSFLAVVGASGIGKSSLVRAGLIPLLRQSKNSVTDWQTRLITPGQHPLRSLAAAFVDPDAAVIERAEQLRRAEQLMQFGEAGFVQLVRGMMLQNFGTTGLSSRRSQLLLVIDQFEEIFTQGQTDWENHQPEIHQFIACLVAAIEVDCLKVVIVLRSDFIPQCRQYEPLVAQIAHYSVIVPPLKYDQLKAAIVHPAQKAGLRCEPNLVYTLLLDVIGAPGELSLLQSTLLELWQRRQLTPEGTACLTLDSYRELGGIRQLLQVRATDVFQDFDTAEQAIAQRIFLALTHFGIGTEDTRRRIFKSQLVSPASAPEKAQLVERILEKLISAKLLVTDQAGSSITESLEQDDRTSHQPGFSDAELFSLRNCPAETVPDWSDRIQSPSPEKATQPVVDVAHEALIRHWSLLRQWCNRDREILLRQRELEEAAQSWYNAGQPASIEFLLTGRRLEAAEELVAACAEELSALTQEFVLASRKEARRMQRESRQLKIAVPAFLLAALTIVVGQYFNALQSKTEKEHQLRVATARERAAITQNLLQEASSSAFGSDAPTTALLIGRLAAQEEPIDLAQTSLRLALQNLRLQLQLPSNQTAVQQLEISPDRHHLAAASGDGKIRLWTIQPYQLYGGTITPQPGQTLDWTIGSGQELQETVSQNTAPAEPSSPCRSIAECDSTQPSPVPSGKKPLRIARLQFSPNSLSIAAFTEGLPDIKVWSTQYGALVLHLKGSAPVTQLRYSPTGKWLVSVHADRSLAVWSSDTGKLQARMVYPKAIDSVQFSADGQFLQVSLAEEMRRYRLIQATSASLSLQPDELPTKLTETLPQTQPIKQTVFSEQGKWVATLSYQGQIHLWQSHTGQLIHRFSGDRDAKVQFSPNDRTMAILTKDAGWLYDTSTRQLNQLPQIAGTKTELIFSADGRWIVTRSATDSTQQTIQVWDGRSGEQVGTLPQDSEMTQIRFSPDNTYLITGDAQGQIKFWSVQTAGELPTLEQETPTASIAFLQHGFGQNGTQLLTIAANGQLQPWRLPDVSILPPKPMRSIPMRSIPIRAIHSAALKPENFWQKLTGLAAQNSSKAEAAHPAQASIELPLNAVKPVQTVWQSQSIAGKAAESGWKATLSQAVGWSSLPVSAAAALPDRSSLSSVAFSANGEWRAVADRNGTIALQQQQPNQTFQTQHRIQNWRSGNLNWSQKIANSPVSPIRPEVQHNRVNIRQLHFSPDQRLLLGVGDDFTVRLWNVASGELVQIWSDHKATIQQAKFSADGSHIITASQDKTAQILAVKSTHSGQVILNKPIRILVHETAVHSSSFSPDRQQIVTGSADGKARVYDATTGELRLVLAGHQGTVTDVQYSPDGNSIVTVSTDSRAIVWNARTGEQRALLSPAHQDNPLQSLKQAAFSPDGHYIAALTQTGQVYLWVSTWEHLLTLAQERTPRQLTPEECSRYLNLSFDQCPKLPL